MFPKRPRVKEQENTLNRVCDQVIKSSYELLGIPNTDHVVCLLLQAATCILNLTDNPTPSTGSSQAAASAHPVPKRVCFGSVPPPASAALPPVPLFASAQAGGGLACVPAPTIPVFGPCLSPAYMRHRINTYFQQLGENGIATVVLELNSGKGQRSFTLRLGNVMLLVSQTGRLVDCYFTDENKGCVESLIRMLAQQNIGVIGTWVQYGMVCCCYASLDVILATLGPTLVLENFNRDRSNRVGFTCGEERGESRLFMTPVNSVCVQLKMLSSLPKENMLKKWHKLVELLPLAEHNSAVASPAAEGGTPCTQAARTLAYMAGTTVASNTRSHMSSTSNTGSSTK
jgi:hypothetical protein